MYERGNIRFDIAQLLQNGRLRRSADIGLWLKQYLEERRLTKRLSEVTPRPLKGNGFVDRVASPARSPEA